MDILIISETKKKGNGTENLNGIIHCWSGVQNGERAKAGVGILINKKLKNCIQTREPINEKIIRIVMKMYGREFMTLSVYGPNEDRPVIEKEYFMDSLKEQLEKVKDTQEIIIAGDINGRTGTRQKDDILER